MIDYQSKRYIAIAFIILALAVLLGAFGAHFLKENISTHYLDVYQTANRYHFIHGLGLAIVIYVLSGIANSRQTVTVALFFIIGIILFSGSLYILSIAELIGIPQLKIMGAITPFGGVSFIMAWVYSAYLLIKS